MSSADLAHKLTLCVNSYRLVCVTGEACAWPVTTLLFCLFPTFKERVSLPIEVTVWAANQPVIVAIAAPYFIWECKGTSNFLLGKFWAKIF